MQAINSYFQSNIYIPQTNKNKLAKNKSEIKHVNTKTGIDFCTFTSTRKAEKKLTFKGRFEGLSEVGGNINPDVFEYLLEQLITDLARNNVSENVIGNILRLYKHCKEWAPTLGSGYRVSMAVDDSTNFYRKLREKMFNEGPVNTVSGNTSQFDRILNPQIYEEKKQKYGAPGILELLKQSESEIKDSEVVGEHFEDSLNIINSLDGQQLQKLEGLGDFLGLLREIGKGAEGEFAHLENKANGAAGQIRLQEEQVEEQILGQGYFSKELKQAGTPATSQEMTVTKQGQQLPAISENPQYLQQIAYQEQMRNYFADTLNLLQNEDMLNSLDRMKLNELLNIPGIMTLLRQEEHLKFVKQLKLLQKLNHQSFITISVDRPYIQKTPHEKLHEEILNKGVEPFADDSIVQVINIPMGLLKFINDTNKKIAEQGNIFDKNLSEFFTNQYLTPLKSSVENLIIEDINQSTNRLDAFVENNKNINETIKSSLGILEEINNIGKPPKPIPSKLPTPDRIVEYEKLFEKPETNSELVTTASDLTKELEIKEKKSKLTMPSLKSIFHKKQKNHQVIGGRTPDPNNGDHDYQRFCQMMK